MSGLALVAHAVMNGMKIREVIEAALAEYLDE